MTNFPITDRAEIAKLPDGFYLTVKGYSVEKWGERMQLGGWPDKSIDASFTPDFIASHHGGIAGPLVLGIGASEAVWIPLDESHKEADRAEQAEAQRDRAVEFIQARVLGVDHACDNELEQEGYGYCDVCDLKTDARTFLTEQEPCQRCGGAERVTIGHDMVDGVRYPVPGAYPDCASGEAGGAS